MPLTTPHHTFLLNALPSPSPPPSLVLPSPTLSPATPTSLPRPFLRLPLSTFWVVKGVTQPQTQLLSKGWWEGSLRGLGIDANTSRLHCNPESPNPRIHDFPGPAGSPRPWRQEVLLSCRAALPGLQIYSNRLEGAPQARSKSRQISFPLEMAAFRVPDRLLCRRPGFNSWPMLLQGPLGLPRWLRW